MVDTPDGLRAWALAWDDGQGNADLFRPALLDDPSTGCWPCGPPTADWSPARSPSRSDEVVGVSNLFALEGGPDAAWTGVLEAVSILFPALPVVDYASGDDLVAALRHGFRDRGAAAGLDARPVAARGCPVGPTC